MIEVQLTMLAALIICLLLFIRYSKEKTRTVETVEVEKTEEKEVMYYKCKHCGMLFESGTAIKVTDFTHKPVRFFEYCPHCRKPLREISIRKKTVIEELFPEEEKPPTEVKYTYLLEVPSDKLAPLKKVFDKLSLPCQTFSKQGKLYITLTTHKKLRCDMLKERGYIKSYEVSEVR